MQAPAKRPTAFALCKRGASSKVNKAFQKFNVSGIYERMFYGYSRNIVSFDRFDIVARRCMSKLAASWKAFER